MTDICLIAGVARNGAIGRDNDLLWRLPADMAHFKALTLGHPVIMGRKTWDSIPAKFRPLVQRRNLVLTRQDGWMAEGAEVFASLEQALAACAADPVVHVMGGAQIYAQALPFATRLELTEVDADYEADCFFPNWDRSHFAETSRVENRSPEGLRFDFVSYRRLR